MRAVQCATWLTDDGNLRVIDPTDLSELSPNYTPPTRGPSPPDERSLARSLAV
jgi:hypothetical protein